MAERIVIVGAGPAGRTAAELLPQARVIARPDATAWHAEPGRLWLCRGMVILLVRLARQLGHTLCPNYFLSERALALAEQSLYTAHELVQMVPVAGMPTYRTMRRLNQWADRFLPNAQEPRSAGAPRDEG